MIFISCKFKQKLLKICELKKHICVCVCIKGCKKDKKEMCGIKTTLNYNEEKGMLELWLKKGDIEKNLGHSNIADLVLKKNYGKKIIYITEKEKQKCNSFFEVKKGVFIIEKLASYVIEGCKLPETIDFIKRLG